MYFTQEILLAKDPQHMEYVSLTQKRLSQRCAEAQFQDRLWKKKIQWMKKQAIFWFDSGNPQDGARPRLRCEGAWTVKWWRGQTAKQVENEGWVTARENTQRDELSQKLDGNGSKRIKVRCESLVQCSFFKGSTAEAYKQFFKCGFALSEPRMAIKTAFGFEQVCARLCQIDEHYLHCLILSQEGAKNSYINKKQRNKQQPSHKK